MRGGDLRGRRLAASTGCLSLHQVPQDVGHFYAGTHIFVADKGDYYDIADGLPQDQQ